MFNRLSFQHGRQATEDDAVPPALKSRIEATLAGLNAKYGWLTGPVTARYSDFGGVGPADDVLAHAGNGTMIFHTNLLTEEIITKYEREWRGMVVNPTLEGVVIHEFGHVAFKAVEAKLGLRRADNLAYEHLGIENGNGSIDINHVASAYGQENHAEAIAENFAAFHEGRAEGGAFSANSLAAAQKMWSSFLVNCKNPSASLPPLLKSLVGQTVSFVGAPANKWFGGKSMADEIGHYGIKVAPMSKATEVVFYDPKLGDTPRMQQARARGIKLIPWAEIEALVNP